MSDHNRQTLKELAKSLNSTPLNRELYITKAAEKRYGRQELIEANPDTYLVFESDKQA